MPVSPPRACATPTCINTTTHGASCTECATRVEQSRQREVDAHRDPAVRRLYGAKWKRYSKQFLALHPLCADPYTRHPGAVVPSQQTDHIAPHKGDIRLFWNPKNHQALCSSCGAYKSAVEEGGRAHRVPITLPPPSGIHGVK